MINLMPHITRRLRQLPDRFIFDKEFGLPELRRPNLIMSLFSLISPLCGGGFSILNELKKDERLLNLHVAGFTDGEWKYGCGKFIQHGFESYNSKPADTLSEKSFEEIL